MDSASAEEYRLAPLRDERTMPRTVVTRWLQALVVLLYGGVAGAHPLAPSRPKNHRRGQRFKCTVNLRCVAGRFQQPVAAPFTPAFTPQPRQ